LTKIQFYQTENNYILLPNLVASLESFIYWLRTKSFKLWF